MESFAHYWNFFVETEKAQFVWFYNWVLHTSFLQLGSQWVLLGLFLMELLFPWRRQQPRRRPGLGLDLFYYFFNSMFLWVLFGNAVLEVGKLLVDDALQAWFGITNLVAIELKNMQMWARFVLLAVVTDLAGYFGHILLHRVGFLWEFHKIHHSSTQLDVFNAQRFHFGEMLFYPFLLYVPLSLIGWPAGEVYIISILTTLFSTFTHANIRIPLGPLKYVINNPQLHLWHHSRAVDPKRNVNYGDALSCWDYLFGTAYLPPERELELGFEGVEEFPTGLVGQTAHPFKAIFHGFAQKLSRSSVRASSRG